MPAVSKAQQRFMGMVHAAQKSEDPTPFNKDVKKAAASMSDKSAKDFASTKHKGLPDHVKEGMEEPEEPSKEDLDDMPSPVAAVSNESDGITTTATTQAPKPLPTNNILWKATGKVCEGRSMAERVKMYEKKGGGWRMGKHVDETVYTTLKEFYTNEIKPRKEAKELIVKRRMGENFLKEDDMAEPGGDVVSKTGVQDHEVSMARASLLSMSRAIQDLMGKLGTQEKDLPGWVQDHITNAENYIVQAAKGYQDSSKEEMGNHIHKPENTNYAPAQNGK
jgi:hypothetical protein